MNTRVKLISSRLNRIWNCMACANICDTRINRWNEQNRSHENAPEKKKGHQFLKLSRFKYRKQCRWLHETSNGWVDSPKIRIYDKRQMKRSLDKKIKGKIVFQASTGMRFRRYPEMRRLDSAEVKTEEMNLTQTNVRKKKTPGLFNWENFHSSGKYIGIRISRSSRIIGSIRHRR